MSQRQTLLKLHRYIGLTLATFLLISGVTGSLLTFRVELEEWLNPEVYSVQTDNRRILSPSELVTQIERDDPKIRVRYLPLNTKANSSLLLYVDPKLDPDSGMPYQLDYDEIFVNPVTGEVVGKRRWGACCFERLHIMPFLFELHRRLLLPGHWGTRTLGTVAFFLSFLCVIGIYLTFPRVKPFFQLWKKMWFIRVALPSRVMNLQLHRTSGLWLAPILLCLALTGMSINLHDELLKPVMSVISPINDKVYDQRASDPPVKTEADRISFDRAISEAQKFAQQRKVSEKLSSISYSKSLQLFTVRFNTEDGSGLGPKRIYVDAFSGDVVDLIIPGEGSIGDITSEVIYPLHTGEIAGLTGRILVLVAGIVIILLTITGFIQWQVKRLP